MSTEIKNITQDIYLAGASLSESLAKFGDPKLLQAHTSANKRIRKSADSKGEPGAGFIAAVEYLQTTLHKFQDASNAQKLILAELKNGIMELIKLGNLIAIAFKSPRDLEDQAICIPPDIFINGELNWDNSKLKYENMDFIGIRLIEKIELKIPELNKLEKIKTPEIKDLAKDQLITEKIAADFLSLSFRTLQGYRTKGCGPEYIKLNNGMIRYQIRDLLDWIEKGKKWNTSE